MILPRSRTAEREYVRCNGLSYGAILVAKFRVLVLTRKQEEEEPEPFEQL